MKITGFERASSAEFKACSLCHFFSASHDIGNYSALVYVEPGRPGCDFTTVACHIQMEVN